MTNWRIIIPTRDSSAYIEIFYKHYQKLSVQPIYIVDSRSSDATVEKLRDLGAKHYIVDPQGSFGVTELISTGCERAGSRWIVRLDDDEFPTNAMIDFIDDKSKLPTDKNYSFNREWLVLRHRKPSFYRVPRYRHSEILYDMQHRMFLNEDLSFDHQIHTVGIVHKRPLEFAPPECFIAHFDALLKTEAQQL